MKQSVYRTYWFKISPNINHISQTVVYQVS